MMIKTLFLLSFLFFIYSFIGWILEVVQSAFHQKRLVNRGFINSPLCISYGIGAIVITINTASDDRPMDLCCRHDRCHSH